MIYAIAYNATGYFDPLKYCVCEFAAVNIETGDSFHCYLRVNGPWQCEEYRIYNHTSENICFDDFIIKLNDWLYPGYHEWIGLMSDDEFYLRDILRQTKLYPESLGIPFNSRQINHKSSILNQARQMADIYRDG